MSGGRTISYVVVALVLSVLAWFAVPSFHEPELFDDAGQEFFASFDDPAKASALEVVSFDEKSAVHDLFRVERKDGVWTIPSHHGYPADATDKMAKAAGVLIGLVKGNVVTEDPAMFPELGVVDPLSAEAGTDGRGKLIRFQDEAGNDLAALIVGKKKSEGSDLSYVRVPDKKRVYTAKLPAELSTKFADWIESDLTQVNSWDIDRLVFDDYKVDETTSRVLPGEKFVAGKKDGKWVVGDLPVGEKTKEQTLRDVATAIDQLKIVGVRPKPAGVAADLSTTGDFQQDQLTMSTLSSKGFFPGRPQAGDTGMRIYSNEGDLLAMTTKGILYTLRFGEVVYGSGDQISAGGAEDSASATGDADEEGKACRYLMITANFDSSLLEAPKEQALSKEALDKRKDARNEIQRLVDAVRAYREKHDDALPENVAQLAEGDAPPLDEVKKDPWGNDYQIVLKEEGRFAIASFGSDGAEGGLAEAHDILSDAFDYEDGLTDTARKWTEFDEKKKTGEEEAKKLTKRFAPWYYVIDDESFQKLKVGREQLVEVDESAIQGPTPPEDSGADSADADGSETDGTQTGGAETDSTGADGGSGGAAEDEAGSDSSGG